MDKCKNDFCVKNVPIFKDLELNELKKINKLVKHKTYQKGELIFMEGEIGKNIYILNSGRIKLTKTDKKGKEYILQLLNEGQFFGEFILFKEEKLSSTAEALTDCELCLLRKNDLEDLILHNPKISYRLLGALSSRLKKAEDAIESLALKNAKQKTIRLLVDLAKDEGKKVKKGIKVKLPLSREGLANFSGMTQETLSRKLSQLEDENVIIIKNRKEIIINEELL